jgi:3-hydroxy acid dehydrogenase/malonic semialdehyde reductase
MSSVAIITGASAGIGEATARILAEKGWKLVLIARREDRLQALAAELPGEHLPLPLDLLDGDTTLKKLENLPEGFNQPDLLVNNAGFALGTEGLHEGNLEEWEKVFGLNVLALLRVSRLIVPGMLERGKGQVINIGSIAGRQTYPGGGVYCASKAAELALSRGLGIDLVATPIRVCSIDPGLVETEFSGVRFRGDTERAKAVYNDITPLTGRDIAEAVLWVVERPAHVQISEMVIFPTCQASVHHVHRG